MALTLCVLNIHYLWTRATDHYRCICATPYQHTFQWQRLTVHTELVTETSTTFQHRPIPQMTQPPAGPMARTISFQISNRISLFLCIFGVCSLSIQSVGNCHISWYVILAHFAREKMTESVTLWVAMIGIDCSVLMWFDCWIVDLYQMYFYLFPFPSLYHFLSLFLSSSPRNLQPVRGCTVWICYALLPSGRPWACKPLRTASATKRESRVGLRAPF